MATNRIDILDPALLRPGRIDRKIEFPHPNEASREQILRIHSRKMNLMRGIDLKKVAGTLGNANGAECKAVCTEAGMFALRERRIHVTQGEEGSVILCTGREFIVAASISSSRLRPIVHCIYPGPSSRRVEDFEMAVAKVMKKDSEKDMSLLRLFK